MTQDRLNETFNRLRAEKATGLIPYVTVGFPNVETTLELVPALVKAGADIVELGVPFSDPLADGATIQQASFHALGQGVTLKRCLEVCATLRRHGVEAPLIFMGYYNPILSMGLDAYAQVAAEAGLDGTIVPDLPPEECLPLQEACRAHGIHLIPLLAPTSTDERIERACESASGFVYVVSVAGVTGARESVPTDLSSMVRRVRAHTRVPVAVGFGLSKREHILEVGKVADAAVVGSALVNVIAAAPRGEAVSQAAAFIAGLSGTTLSATRGAV